MYHKKVQVLLGSQNLSQKLYLYMLNNTHKIICNATQPYTIIIPNVTLMNTKYLLLTF